MELYEGGQYRIDIVGADSSLIVDSITGTIRANIADNNGTVVLDTEIAKMYGTIQGNIENSSGDVVFNATDNKFYGDIDGTVWFNEHILLNQHSVNVPLNANILNQSGNNAYNFNTGTFDGKFKGQFVDVEGNTILDSAAPQPVLNAALQGNIYNDAGVKIIDANTSTITMDIVGNILEQGENPDYAYNASARWFKGHFNGDLIADDGTAIIDKGNRTATLTLVGDVVSPMSGATVYDSANDTFNGWFKGVSVDNQGTPVLDNENKELSANVYDVDGNILLDYTNRRFYGEIDAASLPNMDSLSGNILDNSGNVIFDNNALEFEQSVGGTFTGNFAGSLLKTNGEFVYDSSSDFLYADQVIATGLYGDLYGSLKGDIVHSDGTLFDYTLKHFSGVSLAGSLFDDNGLEVFDPTANTLSTKIVYTDSLVANDIDLDQVEISSDGIKVVVENAYSMPALHGKFYRASTPNIPDWYQQGIRLETLGGSWLEPAIATPGQKLPAIGWNAAISIEEDYEDSTDAEDAGATFSTIAGMYAKIPADAVYSTSAGEHRGSPGELVFMTQSQEYTVNYMILDSEGKLSTKLNTLNVVGETGVTPSNTSTPDSWLQATVNGETKFIPLYS